jgi:asparaginyl-tRNA synthetase
MIRPGEYIRDIFQKVPGTPVVARGWVKTRRDSKGVTFIQLSDGSTFQDLQVVIDAGTIPEETLGQSTTGACLAVNGTLVESPGAGQAVELKASALEVLGTADPQTYPLQKKGHTMEFLREIAHLRPRSNTFGAVFRVRNAASFAIHRFLQDNGFVYVQTPLITTSDCEGSGAMFTVTTLDLRHPPHRSDGAVDYAQDFFARPAYLTVSGQLEAEMFAHAFSNVYTFGPTFRAEDSNTPRHLAEFWMIEPEMAFTDLDGSRQFAERFLKAVLTEVRDRCAQDLEFFDKRIDPGVLARIDNVVNNAFEHITYTDAVKLLEGAAGGGRQWEFPVGWGLDLQSEHERYLTEEVFGRPVVVTDYPKTLKPFYMRVNDDGRTVAAMDVLVPRVGEIIGGSQREERYDRLAGRMKELGLDPETYGWYLDLRRFGSVPHSGFGLGLERLLLYMTGMKNIRDVIPCPRTPGSAQF